MVHASRLANPRPGLVDLLEAAGSTAPALGEEDDPYAAGPARRLSREKGLVNVSVLDWASDLSHVFGGHTRADELAYGEYRSAVAAA